MSKAPIGLVLRRGLRRRCPRCGEGPLFRKWITAHPRCTVCGVIIQRNHGDTWFFLLIIDRIPVFLGVVAIFFGFKSTSFFTGAGFFVALFVPLIGTMRERQGLAIAFDYLARIYMPDPSDEIHDPRFQPPVIVRDGGGWKPA